MLILVVKYIVVIALDRFLFEPDYSISAYFQCW